MTHATPTPSDLHDADDAELFEPSLDPRIQDAIGRSLRAHYADLVQATIPDRFLVLLAELEAKEINLGATLNNASVGGGAGHAE